MRRIRDALTRAGLRVIEAASDVAGLSPATGAVDVIVLAGLRSSTHQRAQLRAARTQALAARLVLVAAVSRNGARKALDAGAAGVVLETDVEDALCATVQAVCANQLVVPCRYQQAIRPPLSHREKEILALIAEGLTNRQIADRVFLSESTIKTHVASVFSKLGVASRSEATAMALDPDEHLGLSVVSARIDSARLVRQ